MLACCFVKSVRLEGVWPRGYKIKVNIYPFYYVNTVVHGMAVARLNVF